MENKKEQSHGGDRRRKTENVQKEKGKTVERFEKCWKRRTMDWPKRSRSSHQWEIEKNQETIKNRQKRSWKEWKRGNQIGVCLDELRKIEGKMGIAIR
jgi:hypothetical protein